MTFNPDRHHRQSIRLQGYDYHKAGAYYVTICTQGRECLFGDVVEGTIQLNDAGRIVHETWDALMQRFPSIGLDASVVMPNHFHGIIVVTDVVRAGLALPNVEPTGNDGATDDGANAAVADGTDTATNVHGIIVVTDVVGAGLALPNVKPTGNDGATDDGANAAVADGTDTATNYGVGASINEGAASSAPTLDGNNATLGDVVRTFKSISAISVNRLLGRKGRPLWQRKYYEHIIRNADSLNRIRKYIADNPARWESNKLTPSS